LAVGKSFKAAEACEYASLCKFSLYFTHRLSPSLSEKRFRIGLVMPVY
jgi:hypothetical protein